MAIAQHLIVIVITANHRVIPKSCDHHLQSHLSSRHYTSLAPRVLPLGTESLRIINAISVSSKKEKIPLALTNVILSAESSIKQGENKAYFLRSGHKLTHGNVFADKVELKSVIREF